MNDTIQFFTLLGTIIGTVLWLKTSLTERLARLEADHDKLSAKIDGLSKDITDVRERLADVRERLARVETKLDIPLHTDSTLTPVNPQ
ncbi:MAG: hypothetical protein OXD47_02675 [Gammaproteobacteria bacterium]|nr:hypothetical protein [Gammaproteobacteria bacterium]MCY4211193.1 hypothetical protein [Gammaproteobacteria bacterium]MCY4281905.1 hypothetical protein [Gammaproteobacteria bacterium]MCY4337684.1 hypothetical protein [Gammaproteobacteria bacterium]